MEAALRAGIPVDRRIIAIYMLSAITAGIAGFLSTLRFTAGSAVIGDPLLLSSIAAVIIGGVSLFGGAGTRHRHGDRLAHHRGADHRARHAERRGLLAVHRGRRGRHRRRADRPVARPDHRPRPRRGRRHERAGPLGPQPHQALRRPDRGQRRQLGHLPRRGGGAARRQRRRQVDADQVHLRRLSRRTRARSSSNGAAERISPARSTRAGRGSRRSTRTSRSPTISTSAPTSSSAAR